MQLKTVIIKGNPDKQYSKLKTKEFYETLENA